MNRKAVTFAVFIILAAEAFASAEAPHIKVPQRYAGYTVYGFAATGLTEADPEFSVLMGNLTGTVELYSSGGDNYDYGYLLAGFSRTCWPVMFNTGALNKTAGN